MTQAHDHDARTTVVALDVRLLDGPNLYFPRAALKVSLAMPGYAELSAARARALARGLGVRQPGRPGPKGSETRQRFLMRVLTHCLRGIALDAGVKKLAVRTRPGSRLDEIVIAVPWSHRTRARVIGESLAPALRALLEPVAAHPQASASDLAGLVSQAWGQIQAQASAQVAAADAGPPPSAITPTVPVVSITGTNGKTTTTRLVGHMAMTAGLTAAWSSTDGVVVMGELVEAGDYSGPAGARGVLTAPGLDIGILETARGGMLLKGMGVTHNDVSVVTNVSADHLGLHGIDTLDQLAEVKAIVTTVTKPDGWAVLNGEDPRVWAMRAGTKASPWAFALKPDVPALREAMNAGGRATTVLDGDIVVLSSHGDVDRLVSVDDVPITLRGLSTHNVANALAGASAALALGIPRDAVVAGLRSFAPDPLHNSGRMNMYSITVPAPEGAGGSQHTDGAATVIVDLAHNEAGLEALLAVCAGIRAPGSRILLALGVAGDRPDDAIATMGEMSVRGADVVVIAHKERYLRGRTTDELNLLFRSGMTRVGHPEVPAYPTELSALEALVAQALDGDVVTVMCHAERAEIDSWLRHNGATVDSPGVVRTKVERVRAAQHASDDAPPAPEPPAGVSVRAARSSDVAALSAIYAHSVHHTLATLDLQDPGDDYWLAKIAGDELGDHVVVAQEHGRVLGYAYSTAFRPRPGYASTRETSVYVDPAHLGRRIGTTLYEALLELLLRDGVHLAVAVVAEPNEASTRLHERLGFTRVGTFEEVGQKFDHWVSTTWWQRRLL